MEPAFILIICALSFKLINAKEPECSKFHYEEKLLEKMIRTEIKFEHMLKEMRAFENNVRESMGATGGQIQDLLAEWAKFKGEVTSEGGRVGDFHESFQQMQTVVAKNSAGLKQLEDRSTDRTVAFYAHTLTQVTYISNEDFKFTTILFNHGDGYDASTGKFTAPVAGIYLMSVFLCTKTGSSSYIHLAIMLNNNRVAFGSVRDYDCISPTVTLQMSKGDTAWVKCTGSSSVRTDSHRRNSFSGALLK